MNGVVDQPAAFICGGSRTAGHQLYAVAVAHCQDLLSSFLVVRLFPGWDEQNAPAIEGHVHFFSARHGALPLFDDKSGPDTQG